jgi:hypothetical protein
LNRAQEYYQKYKRGDKSGQEFVNLTDFIAQHSDIAETPLLLHLLTAIEFTSEENRTLGQLYEKVVDNWFKKVLGSIVLRGIGTQLAFHTTYLLNLL